MTTASPNPKVRLDTHCASLPQTVRLPPTRPLTPPQCAECPDELYTIMRACWEDVDDRPSFAELEKQVRRSTSTRNALAQHNLNSCWCRVLMVLL